jgi:lysine-N-methylase
MGWKINISKEEYLDYRKIKDNQLKPIFTKMIIRNKASKHEFNYAKINMDCDNRCPFLSEKNLCNIQIKLGENKLSKVCSLYPRYINLVDGKYERSATISCPEIGRIALFNSNGISFEQVEDTGETVKTVSYIMNTLKNSSETQLSKFFWDIRMLGLNLLQNRAYTLEERLIVLGIVYKKIEKLNSNDEIDLIPEMLEKMDTLIQDGTFKRELENIPSNTQFQMVLAKELTDRKVTEGVVSERYIECLREALIGLGCIEDVDYEIMFKKYEENYKEYFTPYFKEKEYILENYLVNEFFKELMPFGYFRSVWDSYIYMCVLYSMLKMHLIGMGGCNKGLTDELVLKLIQSFSKVVTHNIKYISQIVTLLKDEGYDELPYMAILVKN